jgi:Transposase DDE domain
LYQTTQSRVRRHVDSIRHDPGRLFAGLLGSATIREALAQERIRWRDSVFTPMVTLWTFLGQVLCPDHSCRAAVARLIALLVARGEAPCSPETGPYCKARQRLPTGVLSRLARRTGREAEGDAPAGWAWRGRRVLLVDGTTVSMPDTEENQRAFPQLAVQGPGLGFPLARLVAVISLATGTVRDAAIGPAEGKRTGETALFRSLWGSLDEGDIVLGDCTFASYFGVAPLAGRGIDVLSRVHQRRKVDFRRGLRLGVTDHVVRWAKPERPDWMDEATYGGLPGHVEVRELRVRVEQAGFRVAELVLVTTLTDPVEFGKEAVAALFLQRWNIELDLRSIKVEMQMDVLRCKTPEMVEREVWAHLLAYNLVRATMARAAEAHAAEPRRLSFKGAMQTMRAFAEAMRSSGPARRGELESEMLRAIATHRVGDRPGRVEPRAKKRRPKPHRLLTVPRREARKRLLQKA